MDIDEHTLELCLATILAVAMVGSQPPFLGVIRMRRAERLLGWAYWPLLHTLDDRERRHKRIRRNDGVEFEQGFTPYHLALRARRARSAINPYRAQGRTPRTTSSLPWHQRRIRPRRPRIYRRLNLHRI